MARFCNRVAYRKRQDAERALQRVIADRKRTGPMLFSPQPDKMEKHAYRCDRCGKWHLTSGPASG